MRGYYLTCCKRFTQGSDCGFFCYCLSESKSPLVSWMHLSILADLKNTVVSMVLLLRLIFSSDGFISHLRRSLLGNFGNCSLRTIYFRIPHLVQLSRFYYLSIFSLSFIFTLWPTGTANYFGSYVLFFYS